MTFKQRFVALTVLLSFAIATQAADFSNSMPAVSGYDVVSYQTEKRPIRGNGHFLAVHEGATYLFANQDNLETFTADPDRYAPAYGGFCAFGVSVGKKFIADPEVWRVVDNRLYLNLDTSIQDDWLKDVPGRITKANSQWSRIINLDPAKL